jgi:hypothetical protein
MRKALVHCYRDGTRFKSYELGIPETMNDAAVQQPTRKELEDQAKTNLTTERVATPPYAGITFEIEYPRS